MGWWLQCDPLAARGSTVLGGDCDCDWIGVASRKDALSISSLCPHREDGAFVPERTHATLQWWEYQGTSVSARSQVLVVVASHGVPARARQSCVVQVHADRIHFIHHPPIPHSFTTVHSLDSLCLHTLELMSRFPVLSLAVATAVLSQQTSRTTKQRLRALRLSRTLIIVASIDHWDRVLFAFRCQQSNKVRRWVECTSHPQMPCHGRARHLGLAPSTTNEQVGVLCRCGQHLSFLARCRCLVYDHIAYFCPVRQ